MDSLLNSRGKCSLAAAKVLLSPRRISKDGLLATVPVVMHPPSWSPLQACGENMFPRACLSLLFALSLDTRIPIYVSVRRL